MLHIFLQVVDELFSTIESSDYLPLFMQYYCLFHLLYFTGNKVDIREVTPEEDRVDQSVILSWCREQSYGHIETSAKVCDVF